MVLETADHLARIIKDLPDDFIEIKECLIQIKGISFPDSHESSTTNLIIQLQDFIRSLNALGHTAASPILDGKLQPLLSFCHQPNLDSLKLLNRTLFSLNSELDDARKIAPKEDKLLATAKNARKSLNPDNISDTPTKNTEGTKTPTATIPTPISKKRSKADPTTNADHDATFQFPAKIAKTKSTPVEFQINVNNSYAPIEHMDDDVTASADDVTPPAPPPKDPRPEPITIKMTDNWRELLSTLEEITNAKLPRRYANNAIKILPSTIEQFRIIQKYLDQIGAEFHCIQLKSERPRKVLIKGLPTDTSNEEITNALQPYNFEITRISQLKCFKTKKPLPIFMVNILPTKNFQKIYEISTFLGFYVTVEAYKLKTVKQCYNCQLFNHSSVNCHYSPVCVKCAGPHKPSECSIKSKSEIKCANCGGNHTANYGGCPQNPKNKRPSTIGNSEIPIHGSSNIKSLTPKIRPSFNSQPKDDHIDVTTIADNYSKDFPPLPTKTTNPPGFAKISHPDLFENIDEYIQKVEKLISLLEKLKSLSTELGLPVNIDFIQTALNSNVV